MAKINLLPWREGLRKQRQTEFIAYTVASFVGAAVLVFLIHSLYGFWQKAQDTRNARIQTEISNLDNARLTRLKTLSVRNKIPGALFYTLDEMLKFTDHRREGRRLGVGCLFNVPHPTGKMLRVVG